MIALLRRVANPGDEEGEKWAKMRVHYVKNEIMTELNASSKLIAEWDFLRLLRDEGRRSAQAFLDSHAEDLGRRSAVDLDILLEGV
jgi:NTE family protein